MSITIQEEIRKLLEEITINTALPRYVEDLNILLQDALYFDICQRIFPDLRMKIIKIGQNQFLTPAEKVQYLINLLSKELSIDLSGIKGEGILQGYLTQIHHFLSILWKFSQYEISKSSESIRVKSQQISNEEKDLEKHPQSARDRNNNYQFENEKSERSQSQRDQQMPESSQQSITQVKKRNESLTNKNVYQAVLNTMWNQKNRMNKAAIRNKRKNKNQDIQQAKRKYKSYLEGYAKETKAKRNRENIRKQKRPKSSTHFQLQPEDFQKVDNFFQSFAYKFRDQKENFLRRIKKVIHTQEIDRMCYENKLERQRNKSIEQLTKKQMVRIANEHKIRNDLLKEKLYSDKECMYLMKKQYEKYLRNQKKQLKQTKKKQMKNMIDYIDQENRKVLMQLEEGGKIEKIVLDMYKRY